MSRTDRRPRRRLDPEVRRAAILAAAAAAFGARPYDQVTIEQVADDVGASQALVHRYYPNKADLYTAVVQTAVDDLVARQRVAIEALPDGVPARDRLRASVLVYLDHVAHHPAGWAAPLRGGAGEPEQTLALRRAARADYVARLNDLLVPHQDLRHDYAVWGYYGFLDAACLHWVDQGCPDDHRPALVDTALGALEGALGDWAA